MKIFLLLFRNKNFNLILTIIFWYIFSLDTTLKPAQSFCAGIVSLSLLVCLPSPLSTSPSPSTKGTS